MPLPLFSIAYYDDEKLVTDKTNLKPIEVYNLIPMISHLYYSYNRDEIYDKMASLVMNESFRVSWSKLLPSNKYILITKTGYYSEGGNDKDEDIISIPINTVTNRLLKVLPSSPDSEDEQKNFNLTVCCLRYCFFTKYIL